MKCEDPFAKVLHYEAGRDRANAAEFPPRPRKPIICPVCHEEMQWDGNKPWGEGVRCGCNT
jgi:hypothetical protein